jgi:hypothetical protein
MAIVPNTNANLATNVRDILNAAGGSVSNDLTSFFKSAAKINMYAKHKPIPYNQLFDLTDAQIRNSRGGLTIGSPTYADLPNDKPWAYTLPAGGSTQPFRLGDFRGYQTDAKPCIRMEFPAQMKTNGDMYNNFYFVPVFFFDNGGYTGFNPNYCLSLQDLYASYLSYYPTVVMNYAAGRTWYVQSYENTLQWLINASRFAAPVIIEMKDTPFRNLSNGTPINVYMCLSPSRITAGDSFPGYGQSLQYQAGGDRKAYTLVRTEWIDGLKTTVVATYTNTISGSTRTIRVTNIKITFTPDPDWIPSSIYLRVRGILGSSAPVVQEFMIREVAVSKSAFDNVSSVTREIVQGDIYYNSFSMPSNIPGTFVVNVLGCPRTLGNNDTTWLNTGIVTPLGNQTVTIIP